MHTSTDTQTHRQTHNHTDIQTYRHTQNIQDCNVAIAQTTRYITKREREREDCSNSFYYVLPKTSVPLSNKLALISNCK